MVEEMKKILIVIDALELGGIEKSLLGMLETIDTKRVAVSLFLMRREGELLNEIPQNINILPQEDKYVALKVPIKEAVKRGEFSIALSRIWAKIKSKKIIDQFEDKRNIIVETEYQQKYSLWALPQISKEEYDLAISFMAPHHIVLNKVSAKKKIAWIHTDYTQMKLDVCSEEKMWEKYDYIAAISNNVAETFLQVFPLLKEKIVLLKNILPYNYILQKAGSFSVSNEMPKEDGVRVLSIGRFCSAKNFDSVPEICKIIRERGINLKWYLIGYGNEEGLIRKKIKENNMEDYVIILGKKDNPYPYIKECEFYIQPSRFEGHSVCVREAQMLERPVIITRYATSESQLKDNYDGFIVPMDNKACADAIVKIIEDPQMVNEIKNNCKSMDYSNEEYLEYLYEIIEE